MVVGCHIVGVFVLHIVGVLWTKIYANRATEVKLRAWRMLFVGNRQ